MPPMIEQRSVKFYKRLFDCSSYYAGLNLEPFSRRMGMRNQAMNLSFERCGIDAFRVHLKSSFPCDSIRRSALKVAPALLRIVRNPDFVKTAGRGEHIEVLISSNRSAYVHRLCHHCWAE